MQLNSARKYQIAHMEYGTEGIQPVIELTLNEILSSDWELCYALSDELDKVLDLEVYQSMYFTPNRDVGQSKAILLRIN
jgi:hypothetical protein